jgi:hypothetical protein
MKKSLPELKRLSHSAMSHVDLIEIAMRNSPNKSAQLAEANEWSKRLVQSCRYLAILRRDFGQNAFDDYVQETEQARVATTTPEPVRNTKETNVKKLDKAARDRILQNANLCEDLGEKITILLRHGFRDEAKALIKASINEHGVIFLKEVNNPCIDKNGEAVTTIGSLKLTISQLGFTNSIHSGSISFEIDCLFAIFGWKQPDRTTVSLLLEMIATKGLNTLSKSNHPACFRGYLLFMRQYYPTNRSRREVAIWGYINNRITRSHEFYMAAQILAQNENDQDSKDFHRDFSAVLPDLINLAKRINLSDIQICDTMSSWLDVAVTPEQALPLAQSSIWKTANRQNGILGNQNCQKRFWEGFSKEQKEFAFEAYVNLIHLGLYGDKWKWVEQKFVELLSFGKIRLARQLLSAFTLSNRDFSERYDRLFPLAFDKAHHEKRFGIAAALSQYTESKNSDHLLPPIVESYRGQAVDIWGNDVRNCSTKELFESYIENSNYDDEDDGGKPRQDLLTVIQQDLNSAVTQRGERLSSAVQTAQDLGRPIRLSI